METIRREDSCGNNITKQKRYPIMHFVPDMFEFSLPSTLGSLCSLYTQLLKAVP